MSLSEINGCSAAMRHPMPHAEEHRPFVFAVSGIKNSGKTTLITKLIPLLKQMGYTVATIKHDGHDFDADREGTDSYKHIAAGADGTCVFSQNRYMIVSTKKDTREDAFIEHFKEYDIIILEGFKFSSYKKIEVVRAGVGDAPVGEESTILALATDLELNTKLATYHIDDSKGIAKLIDKLAKEAKHEG